MQAEPVASSTTQECPACGEAILRHARKCRFCGEYLDPSLKRRVRGSALRAVDALEAGSSLALLLALPGFALCAARHICMDGHMHHPPYPLLDLACEASWLLGFFAAGGLAAASGTAPRVRRPLLLALLAGGRLLTGSLGGTLFLLELPLALLLALGSLLSLARWQRRRTSGEPGG